MRRMFKLVVSCVVLFCGGASAAADSVAPLVVPLAETSVFDIGREQRYRFLTGRRWTECGLERSPEVKAYPQFKSERPVFGAMIVADDSHGSKTGMRVYFAIDATGDAGTLYNRFYVDTNRDLDLTNDTPRNLWPTPLPNSSGDLVNYFEPVRIESPIESGGTVILEFMAHLSPEDSEFTRDETYKRSILTAVSTRLRKGALRIGDGEYTVFLGQDRVLTGRYDGPRTALFLVPKDVSSIIPAWWESDRLMAMHKLGGDYYRFSATPAGDKLTVTSYAGSFGTFEIGKGGRNVDKIDFHGAFLSREVALAVGGELKKGWPTPAARVSLPVGDYLPNYLRITYGHLRIEISNYFRVGGLPRAAVSREPVFGIMIREDRPFILDFGAKPVVIFTSPAQEARVKRGETVEVRALLIDSTLDFMIRDLMTSKTQEVKVETPFGSYYETEPLSLAATVVIMRANGEQVADGILPFG